MTLQILVKPESTEGFDKEKEIDNLRNTLLAEEKLIGEKKSLRLGRTQVNKKHILVVSQYFYPEQFRINDICCEWVKKGYQVTVLTGIPNYPQGKFYDGYGFKKKRKEQWKGIKLSEFPLFREETILWD